MSKRNRMSAFKSLGTRMNPTQHQNSESTSSSQPTLDVPAQSAMANHPPHVGTQADNIVCVLWCVVSAEQTLTPFKIKATTNIDIGDLKEAIKEKGKNGALGRIDAKDLVLWKVSTSLWPSSSHLIPSSQLNAPMLIEPEDTIVDRLRSLGDNFSKFAEKLRSVCKVLEIFSPSPRELPPHRGGTSASQ